MKATIQEAKILRVDKIFKKHKPQGLGFSDTDVVVVTIKTKDEIFDKNFYCRIKGDGTLGHSITKPSEKRQNELKSFIRKYISKEENYNIRNNIGKWKGREADVKKIRDVFIVT